MKRSPLLRRDRARPDVELAILAEARHEVGTADHKCQMVLAVLGIGFGAVLGGLIASDWDPRDLSGASQVVWFLGALLASGSVVAAAAAVWPRYSIPRNAPTEVFYWGHVAALATPQQLDAALDARPPALADRTRHQIFELSHIVGRKYAAVRLAMVLAAASAPCFLIAGLLNF